MDGRLSEGRRLYVSIRHDQERRPLPRRAYHVRAFRAQVSAFATGRIGKREARTLCILAMWPAAQEGMLPADLGQCQGPSFVLHGKQPSFPPLA